MKRYIIPLICYTLIFLILLNINELSDFFAQIISNTPVLNIEPGNEYTKDYDFLYVQNSDDFIPYSYNDLLNIIFSAVNRRWEQFTFYCPKEYDNCLKDITKITNDEYTLTHINNFIHPFNCFDTLMASITENGEITLNIKYLYNENDIKAVNEYVDIIMNDLYDEEKSTYDNLKNIHDYIINNTKYDIERNDTGTSPYKSQIAYGPAIQGYATCNGYADLMAIILSRLGIANFKVASTKDEISYESNGHVWNALKYDNKWVHLDLTWDDPVGSDGRNYLYHKYFLVTTEEMATADHGNVNVEEHNFNKAIYKEFFDN